MSIEKFENGAENHKKTSYVLSQHARERLVERTKLTEAQILQLLKANAFVRVKVRKTMSIPADAVRSMIAASGLTLWELIAHQIVTLKGPIESLVVWSPPDQKPLTLIASIGKTAIKIRTIITVLHSDDFSRHDWSDRITKEVILTAKQRASVLANPDMLMTIQEGSLVKGLVTNITDYGAFVDLGGIEGLLHISELVWRRIKHPSEVLAIGDEVTAKVLKFDQDKNRISLSIKQLCGDPWVGLSRRYPIGTRLFGKVMNLKVYGAFVELEQGIEGLIHVAEMDWAAKNVDPSDVAQIGDEVEVMILEIDEEHRRISLGMKQCRPNPRGALKTDLKAGDRTKGSIKAITTFGVFIELPDGVECMIRPSDLSWELAGKVALENHKEGDEIEAVVLGVDAVRQSISLGIKQMYSPPISEINE